MADPLTFAWLGSGRTRKVEIEAEGKWLDAATRRGLPLPNGGILLDQFFQLLLDAEVVVEENGRFSSPNPQWLYDALYEDVRFPQLDGLAVISTLSAPKTTLQAVDIANPQALADGLCSLWGQMDGRRDLLIMEMVGDGLRGTAVSTLDTAPDQIIADNHDPITAPKRGGASIWRRRQANDAGLPDYAKRVQRLLDGVRRSLGKGHVWVIEWADDGQDCWLIGVTDGESV